MAHNFSVRNIAAPKPSPAQLAGLLGAIFNLYMGPSTFLKVFREAPAQAIAALETNPEAFGQLRNYVGRLSLERNQRKLIRLAKRIIADQK